MKTRIFAALLFAAPFLAHAQPSAPVDRPCMAEMGHGHSARDGHAGPRHSGRDHIPPYLHGLDLSEAQQDKVFELMHGQAPLMRDKAKAARRAMEALRQLTFSEPYDESRAKTLVQTAANAESEMALLRSRNDQKIFALLTPEQRKQLTAQSAGKEKMPR